MQMMLHVGSLARRFSHFVSRSARARRYTLVEVRRYFQAPFDGPEDAEIRRMIERIPTMIREPAVQRRYRGFQRYFDVLPRIIFLHHNGWTPAQISEDMGFMATEFGITRVIDLTAEIVAERLNALEGA